ncbi:MAG: phosphate ABC transporter substrate-binding protein [Lentisphaeraceae bacterium]|nr:phosphate ABC transporter substrate-binding protein [Lentisphaeraceae bacterium]
MKLKPLAKALIAASCASLIFSSCETHNYYGENAPLAKAKIQQSAPENDVQISQIMLMKDRGIISEQEALKMIDKVVNGKNTPAPATPSAPVKQTAVVTKSASSNDNSGNLNLPGYQASVKISQTLRSIGSDSMDRMMQLWEKEFKEHHPSIKFNHEGKGSSTAIPALLESKADFGPMSRKLKTAEVAKFKSKFGYDPVQFRVAVDALAVYIHPDNPLVNSGLNLKQLDAVFSETKSRGGSTVKTWGDLGLKGEWEKQPIKVYSRNSASGTYGFFKKKVLLKGAYKSSNKELVGSAEVVRAVAADKFSIGYSGIAYKTSDVAVLPLSEEGNTYYKPNEINAFSGDYPLTRSLFMTLNLKPGQTVSNLHKEFMKYVYSRNGQMVVRQDGYYPVNAFIASQELKKLNR